ncbi:ATP-binding protein [Methylomonas sp. AM2-LC]|uniref:ATP-binding protein n=1 Tax=Methylomonas sp. AM2-LC TaxID=3153301 RepID=UPI003262DB39
MHVEIGRDDYQLNKNKRDVPVILDYTSLVNAHMLVLGKSGTGKTTFLKSLINKFLSRPNAPRIHIMDVHGDIEINGCSSVKFSESTEYGLNPFVVSSDEHFGGVRKRIQDFIAVVNGTNKLGPRQIAVMRNILTDLYAANGFFADNPKSWLLNDGFERKRAKKYPNMDDACRFSFGKLKQLMVGGDSKSFVKLEELNKTTSRIYRNTKNLHKRGQQDEKLLKESLELRTEAISLYKSYIENLETGKELSDFIKYESKDLLKSVFDRFENLKEIGIFKCKTPPFDGTTPVWRYDLCALREDEKRMFVEFRLQEIFASAMERGHIGGGAIREIIVIDEAHLFFRDDENNIINTIAKEGRKFGLGLICASQSPTHFSDDFFSNVASKVVLGVDQMYWDNLVKKMRLDLKLLQFLKPFNVLALQTSVKEEISARFTLVKIENSRSNIL